MLASRLDESYSVEVRSAITPLTVAKVTANSASRFVAPFIAAISSGLHVSLSTVGAAIAVSELVGLSAPLVTHLAGRFERRSAMSCGLLVMSLGACIAATSRSAVQFTGGLAVIALGKIVLDLGAIAWITDRVEVIRVGRAIGLTESAWAIGLFTGVVLMGVVTGLTSWRWGYVLAIIAMVAMSVVLCRVLPDEQPRAGHLDGTIRQKSRLAAGWWVIAATIALMASAQAIFVTFGTWLQHDFGFSDIALAAVIFGFGVAELLGTSTTVRFVDRWGAQNSTMLGAAAVIPAGLALALLHGHLVIGIALLALFIGAFEFAIVSTLSLANSLIPSNPSSGLAMMVSGATLGRAAMSPVATAAFTSHGMWLPAVLGASCASVTALCHLRYRAVVRASPPTIV